MVLAIRAGLVAGLFCGRAVGRPDGRFAGVDGGVVDVYKRQRLGHGSKAVITGDETQIDLPPHKNSGLVEAHRALKHTDGIAIVEFSKRDVVRHPLVQRIISAYEEHRGKAKSLEAE